MSTVIAPGATIGILGGGQLGRMLAIAAAQIGLKCHIYAPETESPAFEVAARHTIAAYDDRAALEEFATTVDVITYEFENIPVEAVAILEQICPVYPDRAALAVSQDRLLEKTFFNSIGIETAPFADVKDAGELARAVAQIGSPSILKTRRFGYDGKGQVVVREAADLAVIHRSIGSHPCVLEGFVSFTREISVIAARGLNGKFAAFDVAENQHTNHILARTTVPAQIQPETATRALEIAQNIAQELNYIGVFAIELFVIELPNGNGEKLIVNEMAPRVHNSGHWTLDGAVTSQFEQHIRAICGWPLGNVRRHGRIEMQNLIGHEVGQWREILTENASLRLYGKAETKSGRKMGHVTRLLSETSA
jgi:5-(carboxyamino)imidazole ribonucleotide synthase